MNLGTFDKMAQDLNNQNPNVNMRHQMHIPSTSQPPMQYMNGQQHQLRANVT